MRSLGCVYVLYSVHCTAVWQTAGVQLALAVPAAMPAMPAVLVRPLSLAQIRRASTVFCFAAFAAPPVLNAFRHTGQYFPTPFVDIPLPAPGARHS